MKWLIALAGAIVGGGLGYLACWWGAGHGIYALAVPGWLMGYGVSYARLRSQALAIASGAAAIALGLFTDWSLFPFVKDGSLGFYLAHVRDVNPTSLALIAIGGVVAFWINFRRRDP